MDSIVVRDLRVKAHVGVTEEERSSRQVLVINLELATDLRQPGMTDELSDTVDYARITSEVEHLVETTSSALLESVAEKIAAHIAAIPGINGVTVEIAKEAPPIEQEVGCVAVRIERL